MEEVAKYDCGRPQKIAVDAFINSYGDIKYAIIEAVLEASIHNKNSLRGDIYRQLHELLIKHDFHIDFL